MKQNFTSLFKEKKKGHISLKEGSLYYQIFGNGFPIIILHGGPGMDQGYLFPNMLELSKNYQLIFYDQRGSGKSKDLNMDNRTINISQFIEDLDFLRNELKFEKFILMGHSWGAFLAMHYAIRYQNNLSALILLNSLPSSSLGLHAFELEYNLRIAPIKDQIEKIYNSHEFELGNNEQVEKYFYLLFQKYFFKEIDIQKLSLKIEKNITSNFKKINDIISHFDLAKPYDLKKDLLNLTVPTFIIHGEKDPIPAWTAEEISKSIRNSLLWIVKNCGHFPFVEKPQELFNKIRNFISKTC